LTATKGSVPFVDMSNALLEKIIPTAKGSDVRMASHPSNPPGLPFGYGYINAPIQAVNSEP
jgi:D-mannonate dehydratase